MSTSQDSTTPSENPTSGNPASAALTPLSSHEPSLGALALQNAELPSCGTANLIGGAHAVDPPDGKTGKGFALTVEWGALRKAYLASRDLQLSDETVLRLLKSCITIIRRADGLSSEVDVPVEQDTAFIEIGPIELRIADGLFRDLLCHPNLSSAAQDRIAFRCEEIPDLTPSEGNAPSMGILAIRTPLFDVEWPAEFRSSADTWPSPPQPETFQPQLVRGPLAYVAGFPEAGHGTRFNNVGLINGEASAESRRTARARLVIGSGMPFDLVMNGGFTAPVAEFLRYLDTAASQTWLAEGIRYFFDERSRLAVRLADHAPSIKLPQPVWKNAVRIRTADFVSCTTKIISQMARPKEPIRAQVACTPAFPLRLSVRVPGGEAVITCPAEWTGDIGSPDKGEEYELWFADTDLSRACAFPGSEWITLVLRVNCAEFAQENDGLHARTILPLRKPSSVS